MDSRGAAHHLRGNDKRFFLSFILLCSLSACGWFGGAKPVEKALPPAAQAASADLAPTAEAAPLTYFPSAAELEADCRRTLADDRARPGAFRRGYCSASIVGLLGGFETAPFVLDVPRDHQHPSELIKGYDLALARLQHTVCPPHLAGKPDTVDDARIAQDFLDNVALSRRRDKDFDRRMSAPGIGLLHLFIFAQYACPAPTGKHP